MDGKIHKTILVQGLCPESTRFPNGFRLNVFDNKPAMITIVYYILTIFLQLEKTLFELQVSLQIE